ncbi:hypothetical protein [Caproiciproducens sp. LBM24188]
MMIKKLKRVLRNSKGRSNISTVVVAMLLIILVACGLEYLRLNVIVQGTRNGMETVITQTCTENYDRLYNGLREGYSGGYKLNNGKWTEDINADFAYSIMDKQLGTKSDGSGHAKYNGSTMEYRISDLSIQMTNTPFAPDSFGNEPKFTGTATYTLTVPLSFGWQKLPPLVIPMQVKAGYTAKF